MRAPHVGEVAVFDLDGTLTSRDTLVPFLRSFVPLPRLVGAAAVAAPAMLGAAAGLVSRHVAKEALLVGCLRGLDVDTAEAAAERFAHDELPLMVRREAMDVVAEHLRLGHRVVVATASPELYVRPWARAAGIQDVVGTRLESVDGKLTGRIEGRNCRGREKVVRLTGLLGDLTPYVIHAYGDSAGDRELLAAAAHPHYRAF